MTGVNYKARLVFESRSIDLFFKKAGIACYEGNEKMGEGALGAYITVVKDDKEYSIGMQSVSSKGKFYPYIGQGIYARRAVGPKRFKRVVEYALKNNPPERVRKKTNRKSH
jgi:hypothetical protein